jgi:hypothetical protein
MIRLIIIYHHSSKNPLGGLNELSISSFLVIDDNQLEFS